MLRWLFGGVLALVGIAALVFAAAYFTLRRADIPYATLEAQYESAASRYQDLPGGVRVHYRDEGLQTPGAPTLLLLHGFSSSLHTWEGWIAELGDTYRIVSLDLPGHGLTRAQAGYQPSISNYTNIVADFVRARELPRFALAGSSMGGHVAWDYALTHPEQIEALILVDAGGWPDERIDDAETPLVFKVLGNPMLAPLVRDLDTTSLVRDGLEASFYDATLVDDAMVRRYVDMSRAPGHRDILIKITLGFRERAHATPERLAPLSELPVLILVGDTDRLVPPQHGQQFADAIAGSELIIYENVGHLPQEEIPERSADDVMAFLARQHARAIMAD